MRGDRGATLIEASIVTPVLMLFVFGIFEFGFAFRDYLAVANSTRDAAREASVAGNVLDADYRILRAVERASAALPDNAIKDIVVFQASGPDSSVPDACKSSSQTTAGAACNHYTVADLSLPDTDFGCDMGPPADPDISFCPSSRDVSLTGGGTEYIGIWMRVEHDFITGLFGSKITFEDTTILPAEPHEL